MYTCSSRGTQAVLVFNGRARKICCAHCATFVFVGARARAAVGLGRVGF
jgi:hypothetical protein